MPRPYFSFVVFIVSIVWIAMRKSYLYVKQTQVGM